MSRNLNVEVTPKAYDPKGEEEDVRVYLRKRVPVLKDSKKSILGGINYESIMIQTTSIWCISVLHVSPVEMNNR